MTAVLDLLIERPEGVRRALVRAPARQGTGRPHPAVVLLHGAGGTARLAMGNTGWTDLADREGILLAYPEGTRRDPAAEPRFLQNPQAWNDGSGRGHTARTGVDDVGFLAELLERLVEGHGADPARLYLAGFSNGASMVFRAGADLAGRVAAIGPVAGHCWVEPGRALRPVPALMIYGALDPLNPPGGGEVRTPWGRLERHPPVLDSFRRWRAFNGCAGDPRITSPVEGVEEHDAGECPPGGEVRCLIVSDLGHHWPGGPRLLPPWVAGPASRRLDGAAVLWGFLRRHRLG
jgi:polyhydroxybutyrate depolymerase